MVDWWEDIVVGVVVGKKTHKMFDVRRADGQKFLTGEGCGLVAAVELHRIATHELHKPAKVGMIDLLAW
mgnify:CR=1 FL=1